MGKCIFVLNCKKHSAHYSAGDSVKMLDISQNDLAIGELLAHASPAAKAIISAYQPQRVHTKNVQVLSSAKFSAENLEICANFLGLKTRNAANDKIFGNKPTIADRIILKIESFFEADCAACKSKYRNKFGDEPLKSCFRCLQGSHDCDSMQSTNQALTMPGAV